MRATTQTASNTMPSNTMPSNTMRGAKVYNKTIALFGLALNNVTDSSNTNSANLNTANLNTASTNTTNNNSARSTLNTASIADTNTSIADTNTADAALIMRRKISIDLHDCTIQPYIGLKLGLEALRRKIPENTANAAEINELVIMAEESIAELRQYIGGLKSQIYPQPIRQSKSQSQSQSHRPTSLLDASLALVNKYQLRHHIKVAINIKTKHKLSEYLSSEIYHLVCEGLSNILRHTQSKKAEVNLYDQNNQLLLEVINYNNHVQNFSLFKPRSMTERVTYLGGTISVGFTTSVDYTTKKATEKATEEALASATLKGKTPQNKTPQNITIVTAKIPLQHLERRRASFG